ncbi:MAG: Gfo/Idh/MocA family oxidoreductase [Gammaproteobacteria bacterium]|nr:MAG: Gfo/Idh/MocA family oxidoreductase [Gammaproteobacteria bacterium]
MRQVVQNYRSGELAVQDVPEPTGRGGGLVVANAASLISAGTEKSTVSVARKNLLGKAMERPEMVRKVLNKARKDGLADTLKMVFQRLDSPVALGYSCAGVVIDVGPDVQGFAVGDRVACAGQGYASHAEQVWVPKNLCVHLPESLGFEEGAYVTLGAIALQGVRQAEPRLGDVVAVIGLGLLGQITVQILKANGCRVVAADIAADKLALAKSFGADEAVLPGELPAAALALGQGQGVDAVIITASTRDSGPVSVAGEICRPKGRVVVVGAVGMDLPREPYYKKELELRLSMSYGPGRYDPAYEEKGQDYPYGYVRWTEQRNMAAFLWLIQAGRVNVKALTSHRYGIAEAEAAYQMMMAGTEPYLGILLEYPPHPAASAPAPAPVAVPAAPAGSLALGLIGAGNHVRDMLLPHLKGQPGVSLRWLCGGTGISTNALAERLGIPGRTTDFTEVLADAAVNAVLIGTRHADHARMVIAALQAGKHVFVEKPLCLTEEELEAILAACRAPAAQSLRLMVGFNRAYSSHGRQAREFFAGHREPLVMSYRVNAGAIPASHWVQDPAVGGGRIIGEGCHFLDFMVEVCGALPVRVRGIAIGRHATGITSDQCILTFGFADGSVGTLVYAAGGDAALAKERFEAFGDGRALVLDDFLVTELYQGGRRRLFKSGKRDKGFAAEMAQFRREVLEGVAPSQSLERLEAVSRACILGARSLQTGDEYGWAAP